MHLRRWLILLLFGLAGCTVAGPTARHEDLARLCLVFAELPGVMMAPATGTELVLSYPGEVLFAKGAALPLAGGTALLDPLAELLAAHPALTWRGTVRAATGRPGNYDQRLAEARAELLQRYFSRRGIGLQQLTLSAVAGAGPPLELHGGYPAAAASSSNSATEKK